MVQVPWPLTSVGVVGCSPFGSYQLLVPPRQRPARSGWVTSTPVSMFATTIPWPRYPRSHSAGALTRAAFVSAGADVAVAGVGGAGTARLGRISRTSWRAASSPITAGVAVTAMALTIHNGSMSETRPCARRSLSSPRSARWVRSARARRIRAAAPGRVFRASPRTLARSACDLSTTIAWTIVSWPAASSCRCSCGAIAAAWSAAARDGAAGTAAVPDASTVARSVRATSRAARLIGRPPGSPSA
jgi:hypothetical protein